MQKNETQEIFAIFSRIFKKRKWLIAICLVAIVVPIVIYNETTPPTYEAGTTLVFEEFANPIDSYEYNYSKEIFFNNQIEEIKSYSFNQDVLRSLPEETLGKFPLPEEPAPNFNRSEYLVNKIKKNISAFPVKGSNIIRITFQAEDRELCKFVANAAADVLQERNYEIKKEGVGNVRQFIGRQLERYKLQLEEAENALRVFKEENNITSVDREGEELMRRMTEAEVAYNQIKTERGSVQNKLSSLKQKLSEQKQDLIPSITDIGSPWAQKLRDKLIELNLQNRELVSKGYPPDHPKMKDIQRNIDAVKKELTDKALALAQGEMAANPLLQIEKYVDETISLQIELESLKAQERELVKVIEGYNRQLSSLPRKEFTLAKLTRETEVNRKIYMMLLEKSEEAKISEAEHGNSIRIIDKAQLPKSPISPRKSINLAIGMLLGFLLGIALAFVLEVKNITLDTPDEVEKVTGWPVLGTIPNINEFSKGKFKNSGYFGHDKNSANDRIYRALISSLEPNTVIAESYRMLRSNLQFMGVGKKYKTVLATSLGPGDGKTTTMSNLAIAFAAFGHKTLLIDSDLRIPQIHKFFGMEREKGITDLLEALNDLDQIVANPTRSRAAVYNNGSAGDTLESLKSKAVPSQDTKLAALQTLFQESNRDTGIRNLNFVPSGTKMEYPKEFVSTGPMPIIMQKFQNRFNVILVDTAPVLLVDDTLMLASIVDAVILVVHPHKYDTEMLQKAQKMLENANANVIGIVFNNFEVEGQYKKYYSSYAHNVQT